MSHKTNSLSLHCLASQAVGVVLPGLKEIWHANKKICLASVLCFLSSTVWAATLPGTKLTNTAMAKYSISGANYTKTAAVAVVTDATIRFMTEKSDGAVTPMGVSMCASSATTGGQLDLSAGFDVQSVALEPTTVYHSGQTIYIETSDYSLNQNQSLAETVLVTITSSTSTVANDHETLLLTETGPDTSVFMGAIQTTLATAGEYNCLLSVDINSVLNAVYRYVSDGGSTKSVTATALVDPYGVVFDAINGLPVDGVIVTLINADTGLLAAVVCDDGINDSPNPIVTGSSFAQCGGVVLPLGTYRFPQVFAGNYVLRVKPPSGYNFPSVVPSDSMPEGFNIFGSPGAGASFDTTFLIQQGQMQPRIDIPIDPLGGDLQITKNASKSVVGEGEYVPYALTISNNDTVNATLNVQIADRLPLGFRYQRGSTRLNGELHPAPMISADGRTLTFALGDIQAVGSVTLKYVAQVTAGAKTGKAENVAFSIGAHTSNTARAGVIVREDLMRSRAILMGRVIIGSCDNRVDNVEEGLQNAQIILEDGTTILTDKNGRWHADNILPGTHVVQLDLDSLPANYEVVACEENSRFAGRNYSQFVNVRGGSLWRADFHVQKKALKENRSTSKNITLPRSELQMDNDVLNLVEKLPYDADWLASAQPGVEWLHPQETFLPALPAIKAAVKLEAGQQATLKLNGEEVNPLYYDGATVNATRSMLLATWSGIHIKTSDNLMELIVKDASGKEVLRQSRNIHYTLSPDRFEFVPEQSRLIADGKTRPIIALRFLDKDGYKMRRGVKGQFQLNQPYQSAERFDAIQLNPLGGSNIKQPRFKVGEDGIALIELMPTTQSGETKLSFEFNNGRKQEIRTWLEAGQRDWILVGFAEGTLGHKQLSGNLSTLQESEADSQLFDDDRIAFYAKGTVKGTYLMTIAYDSAKRRGSGRSKLANLKQAIDPDLYYTLYADATQPAFDATSTSKLYLKIERKQFYLLFGDYDTSLTTTEFARYSRTVTGLKSEYKGEIVGYTAFATMTSQAYVKDELPGDGTSGLYRLSRKNILDNSDKIRIEVRERFQSQNVVSTQTMTRYLDYDIDYVNGTLFFKQPVNTRDAAFNRVVIVAEYESGDPSDETLTAGGRVNIKPSDTLEIGATLVSDGTEGASGNLQGLDATWEVSDATKIEAEFARSEREVSNLKLNGNAWKVEVIHRDAKVYIREQQGGFGIGQQAGSESDTRKAGGEMRVTISDTLQVQGEIYREESLGVVESQRDVLEARFNHNLGSVTTYYGARLAYDDDGQGATRESEQAIAGGAYTLPGQKITLRADSEISIGEAQSWDFPDRIKLGADYNVFAQTKLFVEQELSRGADINSNITLAGVRTPLWNGGEMAASVGNQNSLDSGRLYSNLGLVQKWKINEFWNTDFGIDRAKTLRNAESSQLNSAIPGASNAVIGDYTAVTLGANYNDPVWGANSNFEWRSSETDEKINFRLGFRRTLDDGRILASSVIYTGTRSAVSQSRKANARLSYAHRPSNSAWIWFNRLDYIDERSSGEIGDNHTRKLVNNLNINWMPKRGTQVSLQYSSKYVLDTFDGASNSGYTDLAGVELRHDLNQDWDIGAHASMLHTYTGGEKSYGIGGSLGYKLMDNTWVATGYNLLGFDDTDFSGAAYRSQGAYIALRVKFDQDTIKKLKDNWPFAGTP